MSVHIMSMLSNDCSMSEDHKGTAADTRSILERGHPCCIEFMMSIVATIVRVFSMMPHILHC